MSFQNGKYEKGRPQHIPVWVELLVFSWPLTETVECVPNLSTSDPRVVKEMVAGAEKVPLTRLLDHSFDDYYNRLVVVVGSGNPCFEPP